MSSCGRAILPELDDLAVGQRPAGQVSQERAVTDDGDHTFASRAKHLVKRGGARLHHGIGLDAMRGVARFGVPPQKAAVTKSSPANSRKVQGAGQVATFSTRLAKVDTI